jgi:translation elongation factor EF-G
MTHGRATFRRQFRGYEEMPADAAQRVVAEVAKDSDTGLTAER